MLLTWVFTVLTETNSSPAISWLRSRVGSRRSTSRSRSLSGSAGAPAGFARKMVVELWLFPDGSRVLELSTKCAPTEAFQVAAEARAFLAERGIKTTGAQTTKTRKSLQFFAKQPTRA